MIPIESVYKQIGDFARKRGVTRVILFGSRARGANLMKSDIDIAFTGGDAAGFIDDVQERLWSPLRSRRHRTHRGDIAGAAR